MSATLEFNGAALPGHFAPASGTRALVLIHEYWGLNDHIRSVADRFSKSGYTVFAPDLYGGQVATDADAAGALSKALDHKKAVGQVGDAMEALTDKGLKVGVLGFCMGGALALSSASAHAGFLACVTFYGIGELKPSAVRNIRARVLGHFAQKDEWVTPARVDALAAELKAAKGRFEFHRYDASHAFFNDTRPVYSAPDAKLAFERTLAFLEETLA